MEASCLFWNHPVTTLSPPTKISGSIQKHVMQVIGRPGKECGFYKQVMEKYHFMDN